MMCFLSYMVFERKPVLISSVLPNSWTFGKILRYAQQYLEMMAIAEHEGMDFRFLLPKKGSWADSVSTMSSFFRKKFPENAVYISRGKEERPYLKALNYPRDLFQIFGEEAYTLGLNKMFSEQILSQLGRKGIPLTQSILGEGGLSIRAKNVVVGVTFPSNGFNLHWDELKKKGYDVFKLKLSLKAFREHGKTGRRLRKSMYNAHLDTQMNIAFTEQDNLVMLVNADFNEVFKEEVGELVRKLDAKKFVVSKPGEVYARAVNFVNLPSGKLIVNERCSESVQFLKNNLGDKSVYEISVPRQRMTYEGPLRCRTLVID